MAYNYRNWYLQNQDRLSRKRKAKYRSDPAFRRKVRLNSHQHYHECVRKDVLPDRHVVQEATGERLYTIGKLAQLIRRKIVTVRLYHKKGIIPEPTHYDTRGWRLWTRNQAVLLQLTFRKLDRKEIRNLRELKKVLAENWRE